MPGRNLFAEGTEAPKGRNLFAPASADQLRAQDPAEYDPNSDAYQAKYGSEDAGINPMNVGPFMRRVKGKGEALLNLATGTVGGLAGGLTYLGTLAGSGGNTGAAKAVQEATQAKITYPPKTDEGKRFATETAEKMSWLGLKEGDWAGEKTADLTGSPALGAAVNAGINALPMMVGVRRPVTGGVSELGLAGKAPTLAELKTQATAAYKSARETAGIVPQGKLGELATKAEAVLADAGATKTNEPHAIGAYENLLDEATKRNVDGHSFQGLESIRRTLLNSENAAEKANDARLAGELVDQFDEWADTLKPEDMVGGQGNPQAAMQSFQEGRATWAKVKKAQTVDALVDKARNNAGNYSQSGMENALRRQFVQLANNPKRMRQFSADEQAAILRIVRPSLVERAARGLGKFAIRGPVSGGLDMAMGPAAGVALAGIGEAGRLAATLRMENKVGSLSEMVRGGNTLGLAAPKRGLNVAPALIPAGQQQ